jgi:hypothetical protein
MRSALDDVPKSLTDVINRIPGVVEVLGPSALFFAVDALAPEPGREVEPAFSGDVDALLAGVQPGEAEGSGLREVTSTVFVTKSDTGSVIAACGYRHWPHNIAHMCVLAHPAQRREGAGRVVAARAISYALEEKLLPQSRARSEGSRGLARALGLTQLGDQLSLLIGDDR